MHHRILAAVTIVLMGGLLFAAPALGQTWTRASMPQMVYEACYCSTFVGVTSADACTLYAPHDMRFQGFYVWPAESYLGGHDLLVQLYADVDDAATSDCLARYHVIQANAARDGQHFVPLIFERAVWTPTSGDSWTIFAPLLRYSESSSVGHATFTTCQLQHEVQ